MPEAAAASADDGLPLVIGRYALFDALASGGMATVHLGRLLGAAGFGRTVAVKRLHAHFTTDDEFVAMFMDEARIVARIRHANVVPMVDVIESRCGVYLVMEYVHGESLSKLLRTCRGTRERIPFELIASVVHGVLLGLHAAHDTTDESGELLHVVHRDVSPQNIIVGLDGVARVLDFGVAKAAGRAQITREGQIKGKLAYMAPEQIRGQVDRRADVFAISVVLWEALAGRRLHDGASEIDIVSRVVKGAFGPPSEVRPDIPPELDAVVMRGLAINPQHRYATAKEMALDLERVVRLAAPSDVASWVERLASDVLRDRAGKVAAMEAASAMLVPHDSSAPPPPTTRAGAISASMAVQRPYTPEPIGTSSVSEVRDREERTERMAMPMGAVAPDVPPSSSRGLTGIRAMPPPPSERRAPPRRPVLLIAAITVIASLVLVAGVVATVIVATRGAGTVRAVTAAASPSSATPPAAATPSSEAQRASAASAEPLPTPSAAPSGSGSGAASAGRGASPLGRPRFAAAPRAASQDSAPAAASAAPPKPSCDPPYTVDVDGHRKYKRECMEKD